MTSCSNVFYNGTRFVIDINLDTVNIAVSHVGDSKKSMTLYLPRKEKRADRAIILHTIYINISPGRAYDSKCLIHIILPPLRVSLQARCARCLDRLQQHPCRYGYHQLQVNAEQQHPLLQQHPASVHCQ